MNDTAIAGIFALLVGLLTAGVGLLSTGLQRRSARLDAREARRETADAARAATLLDHKIEAYQAVNAECTALSAAGAREIYDGTERPAPEDATMTLAKLVDDVELFGSAEAADAAAALVPAYGSWLETYSVADLHDMDAADRAYKNAVRRDLGVAGDLKSRYNKGQV